MYKVFYNEKAVILTEKPQSGMKSLKFDTSGQFAEALAILRNSSETEINIYYHNLEKLWEEFKAQFDYLEAAGGLVKNTKGQYLFIYRLDKWDLPKGKVEKGETVEYAAMREVEEECGIHDLILGDLITVTYHIYFQKDLKLKGSYLYYMNYLGDETPTPQTEEGISIVQWKNKEDFPEILENTYENILIVMEKAGL